MVMSGSNTVSHIISEIKQRTDGGMENDSEFEIWKPSSNSSGVHYIRK